MTSTSSTSSRSRSTGKRLRVSLRPVSLVSEIKEGPGLESENP